MSRISAAPATAAQNSVSSDPGRPAVGRPRVANAVVGACIPMRDGGQTVASTLACTAESGTVPEASPRCTRESCEPVRLSPSTKSRPAGTVTLNGIGGARPAGAR